jgi:cyclophilin family peptidyl-prolyl cis-trans isomerase
MRFSRLIFVFLGGFALGRAQSSLPAVATPIAPQTLAAAGVPVSFDLRNVFTLPGVSGEVVQFDTVLGKFNAALLADDAPRTVANFLNYVTRGAYSGSLVHRAVPSFVVQGGGFMLLGSSVNAIGTDAPVANEFKNSNARGTIAMAKPASGADTATSQWFVNLADNGGTLDTQNGGATVFARVLGSGMSVVDAIAALPAYDASAQLGADFAQLPLRANGLTPGNLVIVRSIAPVPVYPDGVGPAVLTFAAESSSAAVVDAAISGATLALTPHAPGSATVTLRATDTNGNTASTTIAVSVAAGPAFTTQPRSQSAAVGGDVTLTAAASGATSFRWQRNGVDVPGATSPTLTLQNIQPASAGVYVALASNGTVTSASQPAVIGVTSSAKVVGAATEVGPNIKHPNGNVYDQLLLTGAAATVTADAGQITRLSYVDPNDDIVQVEFSGAGALTLVLDDAAAPAVSTLYNQAGVSYVKGRASIVIAGANESTYVSVFTVGRANAVNQGLFRTDVVYDGVADLNSLSILSANGKFGGIFTGDVRYAATKGLAGVFAPGVQVAGRATVGDVSAEASAIPVLVFGQADDARVTGGDLLQGNAHAVQVDGLMQLQLTAGATSHAAPLPPQAIRGRLERNGADVTAAVAKTAD